MSKTGASRRNAWALLLTTWALGAQCKPATVEVDPPLLDYGDEDQSPMTADKFLEVGYYHEQLYAPLADGDPLPIIHGAQGGTWVMPAIRTRGILTPTTVDCGLATDGGEVLGHSHSREDFSLSGDNFMEIQIFPVPAAHAPPHEADLITDLFGLMGMLTCEVVDDVNHTAARAVHVLLVEG